MIKNNKQLARAKQRLDEMKRSFSEMLEKVPSKDTAVYKRIHMPPINALEKEIAEYEKLVTYRATKQPAYFTDPYEIGLWLIRERLRQDISQEKLGEKIHLSQEQISRYEDAEYKTTPLLRICEVFKGLGYKFFEWGFFETEQEMLEFNSAKVRKMQSAIGNTNIVRIPFPNNTSATPTYGSLAGVR